MRIAPRVIVGLLLASLGSTACSTAERRGGRVPRGLDPVTGDVGPDADARTPERPARDDRVGPGGVEKIPGTESVRIVWEALAGEQSAFRNPHERRASALGQTGLPVSLINASFVPTPEQAVEVRAMRAKGAVARVSDRDMADLLRGIEKSGFFRYAKPTGSVRAYFAHERARGRITIERGSESVTLVSQYGLGLAEATKAIPPIYASVKEAVLLLKNRSVTVGVSGSVEAVDPERARRGEPPTGK